MERRFLGLMVAGAVIVLALSSMLVPDIRAATPDDRDILMRVLGGTAEIAADKAYKTADVYFHAGQTGDHHHHEEEVQPSVTKLPLLGWIERMHGESAPKEHRHLSGEEEKECLPWFLAAVRLNPRHIDAWRVGAYWYYRTGEPSRAEDFISEAISRNPQDYRLYLDRGILYHRLQEWEKSVRDLESARQLWKTLSDESEKDLHAIDLYSSYGRSQMQD